MRRRNFCHLIGLAPVAAIIVGRRTDAQVAPPAVPTMSPMRTIEIDPLVETAEPPVLTSVVVSPDGRLLAAAGDDHVIRLWNAVDGSTAGEWHGHTDWVRAVAFHPAGKQLLTGGDDHTLKIWDLATGTVANSIDYPGGIVHRAIYLPDGKKFIASGFDDRIRIYDADGSGSPQEIAGASDDLRALAISPNGRTLAAAGRNGVMRIWQVDGFKQVADVPAHRMRIRVLTFSADGARIATAGDDRKFFVWAADGTRESTLANPPGRLMAAAFLDADRLAVGGSDNIIRIIDVATRRELQHLVGHTGSIASLDYFSDTGLLASASFDTTVRLWAPTGARGPNQVTARPTNKTK